ncbi:MAG: Uma2 family endonuclease, partial [Caldilineaceae bacterium SB0675_bin_29]|nr:Uma2 family endonuclease [Caldilineaceae bacterium SB0675_bin_29]
SPSNPAHDRKLKYDLYAEAGVQEYWIIDPHNRSVEIHDLKEGNYEQFGKWSDGATVHSVVLRGFSVPVDEIIPT